MNVIQMILASWLLLLSSISAVQPLPQVKDILASIEKRVVTATPATVVVNPTIVYVATTIAGVVQTVPINYVQSFISTATVASPVSAGNIALPTGSAAKAAANSASSRRILATTCCTCVVAVLGLVLYL